MIIKYVHTKILNSHGNNISLEKHFSVRVKKRPKKFISNENTKYSRCLQKKNDDNKYSQHRYVETVNKTKSQLF